MFKDKEMLLLFDPPGPSQVIVKLLVPAKEMFITSVPEVPYVPDQSPDARHEVALFELHWIVVFPGTKKLVLLADKLTSGAGMLETLPPLPPPPPQEVIKIKIKKRINFKII